MPGTLMSLRGSKLRGGLVRKNVQKSKQVKREEGYSSEERGDLQKRMTPDSNTNLGEVKQNVSF